MTSSHLLINELYSASKISTFVFFPHDHMQKGQVAIANPTPLHLEKNSKALNLHLILF